MGIGNGTLTMRGKRGLGDDGSQAVKRHPWFKGVDWDCTYFLACFSPLLYPLRLIHSSSSLHIGDPYHVIRDEISHLD